MASHAEEIIAFLDQHWCAKAQHSQSSLGKTPEEQLRKLEELRHAYLVELYSMPPGQLIEAAYRAAAEQDQDRPFNKFGSAADYEHYGRCAFLTVEEAVALSLGKNPLLVDWESVKHYLGVSLFAYDYARRLDLVERAVAWGELPSPFSPLQFLTWAHEYKVSVPDAFVQRTFVRGEPIQYWHDACDVLSGALEDARAELQATKDALAEVREAHALDTQQTFDDWLRTQEQIEQLNSAHEAQVASLGDDLARANEEITLLRAQLAKMSATAEDKLGTAERNSLLTLVVTSAIDGYGFDPSSPKNTAASEMASAATRLGLRMTDETALKYIRAGTKLKGFIPPDMRHRKPKSAKRKPKSA